MRKKVLHSVKAYLLSVGESADRGLLTALTALSAGLTRSVPRVSLTRFLFSQPDPAVDSLVADLNTCAALLRNENDIPFFHTLVEMQTSCPELPDRPTMTAASGLLLDALRGKNLPLTYPADREASEWAISYLLATGDESLQPLITLRDHVLKEATAGEDPRLLLLCDLCDARSAGAAFALLRFFRSSFPEEGAPFLGLLCPFFSTLSDREDALRRGASALSDLSVRGLVRPADDRPTAGADAAWILSLPASFLEEDSSRALLDLAAARVMAEAWNGSNPPAAGLHTREIPGILNLAALGEQSPDTAGCLLASLWCLSDLFPALRQYADHPALLRSIAPATRNGLFRRLFHREENALPMEDLSLLERVLKQHLLRLLSLLRSIPAALRDSSIQLPLWEASVKACGRYVTVAAEYDISRQEAEDSGVDKVSPVHRVSMADTEEERELRRLDDLAEALSEAAAAREDCFRQLGGYRSRQALLDCLSRCLEAESAAKLKLDTLLKNASSDSAGDIDARLAISRQERRLRSLSAAVSRCREDLEAHAALDFLSTPPAPRPASPFAGEIFDPALAEQCFQVFSQDAPSTDRLREIREKMVHLLPGFPPVDTKALFRNLLSACKNLPTGHPPLPFLLGRIFAVSREAYSACRFTTPGGIPAVPLLPDRTSDDRFPTLKALTESLVTPLHRDATAETRGLLALLILHQYRRRSSSDAALWAEVCRPADSALAQVYLSSRSVSEAWIFGLRGADGNPLPFALLLPGRGLEIAHLSPAHASLLPSWAFWFNQDSLTFQDPDAFLSREDRLILSQQIVRMQDRLQSLEAASFAAFLSDWRSDLARDRSAVATDALFTLRLQAACGLSRLPAWKSTLSRSVFFYEKSLPEDAVCARISAPDAFFPAADQVPAEEVLYTFRGIPFARESASLLLESPGLPGEDALLSGLSGDCELLSRSSDSYHDVLVSAVSDLLQRFPEAEANRRAEALDLISQAKEPLRDAVTELSWPWDTLSASVQTILQECLGEILGPTALSPFSDRLTLFPARGGEVIGDALLSRVCLLPPDDVPPMAKVPTAADSAPASPEVEPASAPVPPDAFLPPLSADFASALCTTPEGRTLLSSENWLSLTRLQGKIRSVLTLEGAFSLRLIRDWEEGEILRLYAHDMPTLALWPSMPFPADTWKAYFLYAHLPEGDSVMARLANGDVCSLSGAGPRQVVQTSSFPVCLTLNFGGLCAGSLPNLLPEPLPTPSGPWTACLDFGSSASSVIVSTPAGRKPLQGSVPIRLLLRCPNISEELLWREFIPAVPLTPILPEAVQVFSGASAEEAMPFRDGCVLLSASLRDVLEAPAETLFTDLKWNGEKGKSPGLYLHHLMLMTALQARCEGAESLAWRAAIPDEMAVDGRERLVRLFLRLSTQVALESGLPLPEKQPPVSFTSESTALGAYFRFCSPAEAQGGFLVADLGSDTADISLFLRGRDHAVRACQIPLGIHHMLLPSLLAHPTLLREDFAFTGEVDFLRDLEAMERLFSEARRSPAGLRKARAALDAFLADRWPTLSVLMFQRSANGTPSRSGALLLFHFCWLMMLSGLLLLQVSVDPGRNDFLPESMSLFLAGRGAWLMESLPPGAKASLWKILTMFRNPRVSSLNLIFSSEKKLEIPVGLSCADTLYPGLPSASAVPAAIAVRPEELLPEFLLRFRREFPQEAMLLFPAFFTADPFMPLSDYARGVIAESIRAAFAGPSALRPFAALSSCVGLLLENGHQAPLFPGSVPDETEPDSDR